MSEDIEIPSLGGGNVPPEDMQEILGQVTDKYVDIRNAAGQYVVDYKRLRGIRNYNLAPDVRAATAIVSVQGNASGGDFTDIQKAIDYVNDLGGGTVLLKEGTYSLTANLTLYDNIYLIGSDRFRTIIDFGNAAYRVSISGSVKTAAGTFSLNGGSASVTGSGTSFTSAAAGDYLAVNGVPYKILSIGTDTALTLEETYRGTNITGQDTYISDPISNVKIANLTIRNSGDVGIYLQDAVAIEVSGNRIENVTYCIRFNGNYSLQRWDYLLYNISITGNEFFASTRGIDMSGAAIDVADAITTNATLISIVRNKIYNHSSDGVFFSLASNVSIEDNEILNNSGDGIQLDGGRQYKIKGNKIQFNSGNGVLGRSYADGSIGNILTSVEIELNDIESNGGDGINMLSGGA